MIFDAITNDDQDAATALDFYSNYKYKEDNTYLANSTVAYNNEAMGYKRK